MNMQKVLILENDWLVLSLLRDFFKKQNYLINFAQSLKRAEELLKRNTFDLFLCERILPDGDTLFLLEKIKEKNLFMKVLVFSHKKSLIDRITILKLADDFIAKPFNSIEFLLKIKNILSMDKIFRQNYLEETRFLLKDSSSLNTQAERFRPQELKILECFYKHKNIIVSYETISAYVWGYKEPLPIKKTINVYVRRIRSKLNKNFVIETIKNRGYKFIDLMENNT
mgnify:FL=1